VAVVSTVGFSVGFCVILFSEYVSRRWAARPDSRFLPFGFGTTTLFHPEVLFDPTPPGFLSAVDLSTPIPIPKHHDVTPVGEHAISEMHVVSHGQIQSIPDHFILLHFVDALFLSEAVLIHDNRYVMTTHVCHPRYWEEFWQSPANVTYDYPMYESAICLGHQHSSDFGHWFLELLPAYAVIPRNITSCSVVVVPERHHHVVDGFAFLGINECQIVAGINIPVFARHFYTAEYWFCGDLTRFLIGSMARLFKRRFHLGRITPVKYELYNRWNMSRAIGNFAELMDQTKVRWPAIPWEECPHYTKLKQQAKFFDAVKFLFSLHGSVLANIIFMRPHTAVVDLQMEQWLLSFLWLTAYTGKYMVVGRDPRISWRGRSPNIVDVAYIHQLFKIALTYIKAI
jgi:hypothetical protein